MRKLFWLAVCTGILTATLSATPIVQFQVTNLGQNLDRYNYFVSGLSFGANQELDIRFDPLLYSNLTNGVAGSGFSVLLLQPNNPPGAAGDYRAFTPTPIPSPTGPFSVDFTFLGSGTPGSQPFYLNQYSPTGLLTSSTFLGNTTPLGQPGIPEPASFSLLCGALLLGVALFKVRRRSGGTAF